MGQDEDGSLEAARGAQSQEDETDGEDRQDRGFFGRLAEAFGGYGNGHDEDGEGAAGGAHDRASLGLSNLRRMRVEDVAIPSIEIVSVADDIGMEALVQVFRDSGLTRLPVYEGTIDHPVGMVHLKDFALQHGFNGATQELDLPALMRPLLYAPPSMPIGVLLQKMQSDRMHMALVIDEYGGVDGLVTIEDLIEQVIGEIVDEHDLEEDKSWSMEKPGCYLAQAKTPLDEFEEEIGLPLVDRAEEEEIDTLGGVIFVLTGRVPARGEVVPHPSGVEFEVVDADPRRVKRVRVRLPDIAGG